MNIEKLIELGGREWQAHGKHRIYFDSDLINNLAGWEISRYKTGNISGAKFQGEVVSNSKAFKRIAGGFSKLWYDVQTKKFEYKDLDEDTAKAAIEKISQ